MFLFLSFTQTAPVFLPSLTYYPSVADPATLAPPSAPIPTPRPQVTELISSQSSSALQDRLHKAFVALMSGVAQDVSQANRKVFQARFEAFVHDVHGFVSLK
jgi:hypothetical protein